MNTISQHIVRMVISRKFKLVLLIYHYALIIDSENCIRSFAKGTLMQI